MTNETSTSRPARRVGGADASPPTGIIGTGACLPSEIVTCDEMDRALGTRPGWTQRATGIRERRRAPAETSLTDLGGVVNLPHLDIALTLADIYERVEFPQ